MSNTKYRELINNLSLNSQNIATKRLFHLLDFINFDSIDFIVDIGSWHLGQTIEMHQIFPQAKIIAFEPNPTSFLLCQNRLSQIQDTHKISVEDIALTNFDGFAKFYPLDGSKTHSTNEGIASLSKLKSNLNGNFLGDYWVQKEVEVKAKTLNSYCLDSNIKKIDLIWMDVQGAELQVLEGASELLPNVKAICTEAGLIPYYENHTLKSDLDNFLKMHNFVEIETAFSQVPWSSNVAAEADVIYVNKKFILS